MEQKRRTAIIGIIVIAVFVSGMFTFITSIQKVTKETGKVQEPDVYQEIQEYRSTHLFGVNMSINDEIPYVNAILDDVPLHCYNVGIYDGTGNGTVVIYNDMMELIANGTRPHNPFEFIDNSLVRQYFAMNCLHLDTMKQVPENYTSDIGLNQTAILGKWNMTVSDLPELGVR